MALEIRILGRVDAVVDGQPLQLRGSKQRAVLAMLALRVNRTVSADELIDGLWGDRPPLSAAKNLQLYVSRLRKALAENGADAEILTRGRGYELRLPAHAVDALRFERLVEEAARESATGGANGAARSALELWRGAPLSDVAGEPFARTEIRRLEELHLQAHELAIDADLAAGRHTDASAELEALIAQEPLRERFHAQRMLALYRDGRQSEALDAYREAREALIEEIGVEPGPGLQDLQAAILDQDPRLDAPPPVQELPARLEGGSPVLAGRGRELAWLRERWERASDGAVVVALIVGPAGIGKTRLVAELAAEVQDGGGVVLCAGGGDVPKQALATVARASKTERSVLLVLDYADDAPPAVLRAAAGLAHEPAEHSLLVCVLHHDEQGPPAFAALLAAGAAERLQLDPLADSAVAEIAELYAPAEGVPMPLRTLVAASDGVPLRVHRAAGEWARSEVAGRLAGTAGRAADERTGLRAAEADLADDVVNLQAADERIGAYAMEEPADATADAVSPFRGLAPFDAAHAEYFFGRERLVAELVARLVGSTLLAVVGPSGSGKSSAVGAGLLPALASGVIPGSEGWRQAVMRPGEHPSEELARTLARTVPGAEQGEAGTAAIAVALDPLAADERLVLVIDQFEEAFYACRDAAEREAFLDALVDGAGDPDERLLVVIAMRADFYSDCAQHAGLSTLIGSNQVLVGPMRRDELRRAIELPARKSGLRVEPRLVSALIGDVADEPGGLPLLSTTLVELWEERRGRTLSYASYEASGGIRGAVARLAERAYERLSEPQRERARAILLRLTDAEQATPVRRRVPLAELEVESDAEVAAALTVLTESRLVTVDEGTVEVAHEALLSEWPRLRAWLADDLEGRRLHQHLIHAAAEWGRSGRDPAELYRGARLAAALDWAPSHDAELNELERGFLEASRAASEREAERQRRVNRRLRNLLAGVGILLAIAVIAGVIALSERRSARNSATTADAQRLGAEALNEDRLDQALRLASAGVALDDSVETRSNLLSVLMRSPAALRVVNGDGDEFSAIALSPDGSTLALADWGGTVRLVDTGTGEVIGEHASRGPVWTLDFDPRGESLALAGSVRPETVKGYLKILDARTLRIRRSVRLGFHPAAQGPGTSLFPGVNYASDGRSLIATYTGGDADRSAPLFLRRFDARSGRPLGEAVEVAPRSATTAPLSTPDGRLLVATERATYAVDERTLRIVRRYPLGAEGSAAISPDGGTLAVEASDGGLRLLDLDSGEERTLTGRRVPDSATGIGAFSPDGRTLATRGEDETVVLWDVKRGVETEVLAGHSGDASAQVFSADGSTLYTAGNDATMIVWDVAGDRRLGRPFRTGISFIPEEGFPPAFALSPDGGTLAAARLDGRVDLIDTETLSRTESFKAFDRTPATAIEYAPDGRRLAVGGGRGLIGIWDAESGRRVGPLLDAPRGGPCADPASMFRIPRCHDRTIQEGLAFGPDGALAAASIGGAVRIWDLDAREPVVPPFEVDPFVLGLDFSPDGSKLAVPFGFAHAGGSGVEIRDATSGERLATVSANSEVRTASFSPDGRLLAIAQVDGQVHLWATEDWREVGTPLAPDRGFVLRVDFSPDGRALAASSADGTVSLWDVASREAIGPLPAATNSWVSGRFSPDGRRVFALYDNGRALSWEVDPAAWLQHVCTVTNGGMTRAQWDEIVPEQDYIDVCPE